MLASEGPAPAECDPGRLWQRGVKRDVVRKQPHPSHFGPGEIRKSFANTDFAKKRQGGCGDEFTAYLSPRKGRLFHDGDRPSGLREHRGDCGSGRPAPNDEHVMRHLSG